MEEITIEYVQQYIKTNQFDLNPTQGKISFPLIVKYCKMLKEGNIPPAIHIEDDAIVNGHHRYISGHILGKIPDTNLWIKAKANEVITWDCVTVDNEDYGSCRGN